MSFLSRNKVFKRNWNWLRPAGSAGGTPTLVLELVPGEGNEDQLILTGVDLACPTTITPFVLSSIAGGPFSFVPASFVVTPASPSFQFQIVFDSQPSAVVIRADGSQDCAPEILESNTVEISALPFFADFVDFQQFIWTFPAGSRTTPWRIPQSTTTPISGRVVWGPDPACEFGPFFGCDGGLVFDNAVGGPDIAEMVLSPTGASSTVLMRALEFQTRFEVPVSPPEIEMLLRVYDQNVTGIGAFDNVVLRRTSAGVNSIEIPDYGEVFACGDLTGYHTLRFEWGRAPNFGLMIYLDGVLIGDGTSNMASVGGVDLLPLAAATTAPAFYFERVSGLANSLFSIFNIRAGNWLP